MVTYEIELDIKSDTILDWLKKELKCLPSLIGSEKVLRDWKNNRISVEDGELTPLPMRLEEKEGDEIWVQLLQIEVIHHEGHDTLGMSGHICNYQRKRDYDLSQWPVIDAIYIEIWPLAGERALVTGKSARPEFDEYLKLIFENVRSKFGKGNPIKPQKPSKDASRDDWFEYKYRCDKIGIKYTHKQLADDLYLSHGYVRYLYSNWIINFDYI